MLGAALANFTGMVGVYARNGKTEKRRQRTRKPDVKKRQYKKTRCEEKTETKKTKCGWKQRSTK